jgi:hypothetical protein
MQFLCSCCTFSATRGLKKSAQLISSSNHVGASASEVVDVASPSFASQNSCHRRQLRDATTEPGACQMI